MRGALLLIGLTACRTPPFAAGESVDLRGAPLDLARVVDLAVDLARRDADPSCVTHTREPIALSGLALVDPPSLLRMGQAIRVAADLQLRACDRLGDITLDVQIGNATDGIIVNAFAWIASASCAQAPPLRRVLLLSDATGLSNPRLFLRDAAGPLTLEILLDSIAGSDCTQVAVGDACDLDCQCARGRCIPRTSGAVCAVPCANDFDCDWSAERCSASAAPPYTCVGGAGVTRPDFSHFECRCASDCLEGELCDGVRCVFPCTAHVECPPSVDYCSLGQCVRVL